MSEGFLDEVYHPDVLSCLVNLSNDEVFTPPNIANAMLDMLPQELFENPDTTFLDPACKSGIFLREIAKRLIMGLQHRYPNLQERIDHIFHKQLYGIAITELTGLLSRRSLYCSKQPNSRFSISQFDNAEGHIRFRNVKHAWKDGKCAFCGASRSEYARCAEMETHAYEFIHTTKPEELIDMGFSFDVVIGNPPYQLSDGGNAASAIPIYQKFVEQAKKLNPRYLSMIIPARWFTGGRGLNAFRDAMLHDNRLRILHDYPNASDCFPGVEIKGGVCYFLWSKDERGLCTVYTHNGKRVDVSKRPLLEPGMKTFIRNDTQINVLHKVMAKKEPSFSTYLNAGRYFGFHTRVDWIDDRNGKIQTADGKGFIPMHAVQNRQNNVKIFFHGGVCFLPLSQIPKNTNAVLQYKILLPRSGNPGGTVIGKPKLSEPYSCSSNTYVVAFPPDRPFTEEEAKNCISYIQTRFFRYLVSIKTSTQDTPPKAYEFVPVQDFSHPWTDELLYQKYAISKEEIQAIEAAVTAMG